MKKKNYKLINKKRYRLKILLISFLCFCIQFSFGTTPVSVWPDEIKFNYETGYSNDAVTIRNDDGTTAIVPEWKKYYRSTGKFAYIKGQTNRKIQVRFDSNCQTMHLLIKTTVVTGNGIGNICNFFVANYTKLTYVTLPLEGSVPDIVDIKSFTWKWEIYAIPFSAGYCSAMSNFNTNQKCYILLDIPKTPMAEPWTSVLTYACNWASGKTTEENSATKITEALYASGFYYESTNGAPGYNRSGIFKLTAFLNDLGSSYPVNCLDMGRAVATFGNSIGCNLNLTKFNSSLTDDGFFFYPFPLNCIDPIGTSINPTNNPFATNTVVSDCRYGGFGYHAFAENANNKVWDACLKYDIDNDPDNVVNSNPDCGNTISGYTWMLPCEEIDTNYLLKLVDNWYKYTKTAKTKVIDCSNPLNCGIISHSFVVVE